jgi:hypothetical protein
MTWTNKERKEFERTIDEASKNVLSPEEYEKYTQTLKEVKKTMSTFKPNSSSTTARSNQLNRSKFGSKAYVRDDGLLPEH